MEGGWSTPEGQWTILEEDLGLSCVFFKKQTLLIQFDTNWDYVILSFLQSLQETNLI